MLFHQLDLMCIKLPKLLNLAAFPRRQVPGTATARGSASYSSFKREGMRRYRELGKTLGECGVWRRWVADRSELLRKLAECVSLTSHDPPSTERTANDLISLQKVQWDIATAMAGETLVSLGARGRPLKRRKVALACETCRTRKSRCDGRKPVCGNCLQRGNRLGSCVYKLSNARVASNNEYIDALLSRIRELENDTQRSHRSQRFPESADDNSGKPPTRPQDPPRIFTFRGENSGNVPSSTDPVVQAALPSTNMIVCATPILDRVGSVNAMGTNTPAVEPPTISPKFYGGSSVMFFIREVYDTISPNISPAESPVAETLPRNIQILNDGSTPKVSSSELEQFTLFPRIFSDRILDLYWRKIHILYPFIHKSRFMATYEELWQPASNRRTCSYEGVGLGSLESSGPNSLVFQCALNVVLALGLQCSDNISVTERDRLSASCIEKANQLFKLDLFDHGSLSVLQTLLLLTQYFQSTVFLNKAWNTLGAACRIALALGLHVEDSRSQGQYNHEEIEIRRRVWHGCIMLDMVISVSLGRPTMLHHGSKVSLPGTVDDMDVFREDGGVADQTSRLTFFVESIKLSRILGRILSVVYRQNGAKGDILERSEDLGSFSQIVELDTELCDFVDGIPDALRWAKQVNDTTMPNQITILQHQSNVLHARVLYLRILLFRPILTQFCRSSCGKHPFAVSLKDASPAISVAQISSSWACCSSVACVQTAIELINLTNRYSGLTSTNLWWYDVSFTRTAAIVILLAGVCAPVRETIGNDALQAAWEMCRDTLLNKLPATSLVIGCLEMIEKMNQSILRYRNHASENSPDLSQKGTPRRVPATFSVTEEQTTGEYGTVDIEIPSYEYFGEISQFDWDFNHPTLFNGNLFEDNSALLFGKDHNDIPVT